MRCQDILKDMVIRFILIFFYCAEQDLSHNFDRVTLEKNERGRGQAAL